MLKFWNIIIEDFVMLKPPTKRYIVGILMVNGLELQATPVPLRVSDNYL